MLYCSFTASNSAFFNLFFFEIKESKQPPITYDVGRITEAEFDVYQADPL